MGKKILLGVAAIAIIILFILGNTVWKGFYGDYVIKDGHEWTDLTYEVVRGDADKFSAELVGPQKFKVKYSGDYEMEVILTFKDDKESGTYRLLLQEKPDTNNEMYVDSELTEVYN